MNSTVAIIGTGWVGSSVAISTLHSGVANELLLHDQRTAVAEGEAMDLAQGAAFYPTAAVRVATIAEMMQADAIVITAGRAGVPGQSRLDLLRGNAEIITELGQQLVGYAGIIVMVTNPVDVLTRLMVHASGLPPQRVIGTGTMLDTARFKQRMGLELHVDPHSVHGQVVGEHGDSEVVLWSGVRIGSTPLATWPGWNCSSEASIADDVRTAAEKIIQRKGCTNHAIGLVTADLLRCVLRDERGVLTVSRVQADGVAYSMPAIVGRAGVIAVLEPEMNDAEREKLAHSAAVLREAYQGIEP